MFLSRTQQDVFRSTRETSTVTFFQTATSFAMQVLCNYPCMHAAGLSRCNFQPTNQLAAVF
jgi:hypothetical protein